MRDRGYWEGNSHHHAKQQEPASYASRRFDPSRAYDHDRKVDKVEAERDPACEHHRKAREKATPAGEVDREGDEAG